MYFLKFTDTAPRANIFYFISLTFLLLLLFSSKNYLYAIQLKGTQGAKAWPVLQLVKLELKGSVQLKSKVEIGICMYIIN